MPSTTSIVWFTEKVPDKLAVALLGPILLPTWPHNPELFLPMSLDQMSLDMSWIWSMWPLLSKGNFCSACVELRHMCDFVCMFTHVCGDQSFQSVSSTVLHVLY